MEQWKELEEKRKKLQLLNGVFCGLALAGVLLFLWSKLAGTVLALGALLGLFLIVLPQIRDFRRAVKRRVVEYNYGSFVTGLEYQEKSGIPLSTIADSGLLWLKNEGRGYVGREHITGTHKGRTFEQSDVSMLRRQHVDENLERKSLEYVVGTLMILQCGNSFPTDMEILSEGFLKAGEAERFFEYKRDMRRVECGDPELKDNYIIYAGDPQAGAQLLTPVVTAHIRRIRELAGSPVLVGLVGSSLYVLLLQRFVNIDWSFRRPLPRDILTARQLPELPEIFALTDALVQR